MIKFNWFIDLKKEEDWLNQMSGQGYHLDKVNPLGLYTFSFYPDEKRKYRIDCQMFNKKADLLDYLQLFEDSGWRCIYHKNLLLSDGKYYFYTAGDSSREDIFSDTGSRAQKYLRYANQLFTLTLVLGVIYLPLYLNGTIKLGDFTYLTPGLWEMTGLGFWRKFLFETPFVVLRGVSSLLPLLFLLVFGGFYIYGYRLYRKTLSSGSE